MIDHATTSFFYFVDDAISSHQNIPSYDAAYNLNVRWRLPCFDRQPDLRVVRKRKFAPLLLVLYCTVSSTYVRSTEYGKENARLELIIRWGMYYFYNGGGKYQIELTYYGVHHCIVSLHANA